MRACAATLGRDAVSLNLGDVKPKRRYGAALPLHAEDEDRSLTPRLAGARDRRHTRRDDLRAPPHRGAACRTFPAARRLLSPDELAAVRSEIRARRAG